MSLLRSFLLAALTAACATEAGTDAAGSDAAPPDGAVPDAAVDAAVPPPDGAMPCSLEGEVLERPCGDCGMTTIRCVNGFWERGPCLGEGPCTPGERSDEAEACGRCGRRFALCDRTCAFGEERSACEGEGFCEANAVLDVEVSSCRAGQAQVRRCLPGCARGRFSECVAAPPVDIMVLVDLTQDMRAELPLFVEPLEALFVDLQERYPRVRMGLAGYQDVPAPEGSSIGGFRVDAPFLGILEPTDSPLELRLAYEALEARNGGDVRESAVEALAHLAGKTPLPSARPFTCTDVREGGGCWRPGSWRLVLLYTNARSHMGPGEEGSYGDALDGVVSSWDEAREELAAQGMRLFVVFPAPSFELGAQYVQMVEELGGSELDVIALGTEGDGAELQRSFRSALGL